MTNKGIIFLSVVSALIALVVIDTVIEAKLLTELAHTRDDLKACAVKNEIHRD